MIHYVVLRCTHDLLELGAEAGSCGCSVGGFALRDQMWDLSLKS
jgi:hypothetical protein